MPMSHSIEVQHSMSSPGKAGPIMKPISINKHDKKVAMLKLRAYLCNSFTHKHFHLPQITDKQLPWQDSSQPNSTFVFHGTGRI